MDQLNIHLSKADVIYYILLTFAGLYCLHLLNGAMRVLGLMFQGMIEHIQICKLNQEKAEKERQKRLQALKQSKEKVINPIVNDAGSDLIIAGQDEIHAVSTGTSQVKTESDFSGLVLPKPDPDLRIIDLANNGHKTHKPMATYQAKTADKSHTTRVLNVPDQLTDEAISMLESPAVLRYPKERYKASSRTSYTKQKKERRKDIQSVVDLLPRAAVM